MTGRLYVILTYQQKLIWTDIYGITMSIDMLQPFSGHTYQSRPLFEIFKYLIKEKKPCLWMTG